MTDELQEKVLAALRPIQDPELGKSLVELGMIKDLRVCDGNVAFQVELTTPACPLKSVIEKSCRDAVEKVPGVKNVTVTWGAQVRSANAVGGLNTQSIKNIILVASGKGGVGKSTVATNLAVQLARFGAKTGLLDADVYGPSIPTMMGFHDTPLVDGETIIPGMAHGVFLMSMGFFIEPDRAVVWRGPMLHKALRQFIADVRWGELDYLVADLPPGTGDVQLTIAQSVGVSGAVIVSTPQEVALADVRRACNMFRQDNVKIPILGIVENMSGGIFGEGGARKYAEQNGLPFLGAVPLDSEVVKGGDAGVPVSIARPDSPAAKAFIEIAQKTAAQVSINAARNLKSKPVEVTHFGFDAQGNKI